MVCDAADPPRGGKRLPRSSAVTRWQAANTQGSLMRKKSLFNNASMIFTPTKGPIESIGRTRRHCSLRSASRTSRSQRRRSTTDKIAFTSQLAHVVSNAYIKSPTAQAARGLFRRQLQRSDPRRQAQRGHVDRAVPGKPRTTWPRRSTR